MYLLSKTSMQDISSILNILLRRLIRRQKTSSLLLLSQLLVDFGLLPNYWTFPMSAVNVESRDDAYRYIVFYYIIFSNSFIFRNCDTLMATRSKVVSLTIGFDSISNLAASLQEARVAAEKGKCLGVIVNVAVEGDVEESIVEKLKNIFGAGSNSKVPFLFASTLQDVQRFTVSTLLKLSKSGGFVINCISSRLLKASTSLPDCIHSNSENIQTDVEPYEIYGDINHKLKAENIIVCYGTDFLRFKSVIHLFSSDHKIAILKLNRLESINIQDVFNRFESKILRILVPSSDGSFSKAASASLCELEASNVIVGAQNFSINLKKLSQFSLNLSFLNRVLLTFLSDAET